MQSRSRILRMQLLKYKIIFFYAVLSLSSLFTSECYSQIKHLDWKPENEITFFTYPELSFSIQGIAQDKYGYLWLGSTDGLYRFDGVSYKRFTHSDTDSNSIAENSCRIEGIDSRGMLWIFSLNSFSIFNTGDFKSVNHVISDSFFGKDVTGMLEDNLGNVWFCSFGKKNLTRFEPAKNKFISFEVPDSLYNDNRVFGLTLNRDGKIYLAVDNGVLVFNPSKEIYEKHIPNLLQDHLSNDPKRGITYCIISDRSGNIWCGQWGANGDMYIGKYNREKEVIPYSLFNFPHRNTVINSICEKSDSELWIGANTSGLFVYNKNRNQCRECAHVADDASSFPYDPSFPTDNILTDRAGNTWYQLNNKLVKADAGDRQVRRYDLSKLFNVPVDKKDFSITSACNSLMHDKIFITTWGGEGFYEVDLKNKLLRTVEVYGSADHSLKVILKMMRDSKGNYRVYNINELLTYNETDGNFAKLPIHPPMPGYYGFCFNGMMEDSRGHLLLGTFRDGLYDVNPYDASYVHYPKSFYNTSYSLPDFLQPCFEDDNGNVWMNSFDGTYLFHLSDKSFTRISYRSGDKSYNDGRDLLKDKEGNIWRTTAFGGFQKFNRAKEVFEVVKANINTSDFKLDEMVEDNRGFIWMNDEHTIYRFDPRCNSFLNPSQSMKTKMGERFAGFDRDNGILYTSSGNTLFTINTNTFDGNLRVPDILFNGIKVMNRDISFGKNINDIKEITLTYENNFVSFEFAALNYSHSENNSYAYKLDGVDKDWVMNGNKNTASYSNLAPGSYVFRVKGSNNTGLWNETGRSMTVIVLPPWWETWWFLLLMAIAVAMTVWLMVREYTLRKLRLQKTELEKQQAVENVRSKISRDMHDEIGSSLTKISLLSETLKSKVKETASDEIISKITSSSRGVIGNMNEIIWATNPQHDNMASMISYFRDYIAQFFNDTPVKCEINFPESVPDAVVNPEVRRNLFLVLKESLNNILKHANASAAVVEMILSEKELLMTIKDNGKGFVEQQNKKFSNGLKNMKKRMEDVGGSFEIISVVGKGTESRIKIQT